MINYNDVYLYQKFLDILNNENKYGYDETGECKRKELYGY